MEYCKGIFKLFENPQKVVAVTDRTYSVAPWHYHYFGTGQRFGSVYLHFILKAVLRLQNPKGAPMNSELLKETLVKMYNLGLSKQTGAISVRLFPEQRSEIFAIHESQSDCRKK